jgi:hypothetical protein
MTGQRCGRLVVSELSSNKRPPTRWWCNCDCGARVLVSQGDLRSGHTQSCGCLRRDRTSAASRIRPYESLYNILVDRCKRRNLACMTYEEFLTFVGIDTCTYCGENVIHWKEFGACSCPMNLDRWDNTRGYEKDNCVVCCGACNSLKSDLSIEDFLAKISKVYHRRNIWTNFSNQQQ